MIDKIIVFIVFVSSVSYGDEANFIFEGPNRSEKKIYFSVDEIRVSDSIECRKKVCAAYKVAVGDTKLPPTIEWLPGGVNPTSTLCKKMDATPRIGYLENGNELSLCYFKDGSFIFGWDLVKIFKKIYK